MSSSASSQNRLVGVIDVGSNTIKLLIAGREPNGGLEVKDLVVEETRIGEGLSGRPPLLDEEAIQRGAEAISRLHQRASSLNEVSIVATSAVRDAANKTVFIHEVEKHCGRELRVLSGEEEARLIGIGLSFDPEISSLNAFTLLDLGGGSLECIHFREGEPALEGSLQLGSVRLASLLVEDRVRPLAPHEQSRIAHYVREQLEVSRFRRGSSPSDTAVLTGGSASLLACQLTPRQQAEGLRLEELAQLRAAICAADLEQRIATFGAPRSRADIFPTAVVTLEEVLRYLGCQRARFSNYNLRYGVAALLLEKGELRF